MTSLAGRLSAIQPRYIVLGVVALALSVSNTPLSAQIYRYQDKDGNWHFTDRDPAKTGETTRDSVEIVGSGNTESEAVQSPSQSFDLAQALESAFQPKTPIESATLAVVAVESGVAKGSGFFVSASGHIITNKHVVRPASSAEWGAAEQEIATHRDRLEVMRRESRQMRRWLDEAEAKMSRYQDIMEDSIGKEKRSAENSYYSLSEEYGNRKSRYSMHRAEIQRVKQTYDSAVSEHSRVSYASRYTTEFKIILKDDSEKSAHLVKLSDQYDLALLKLDGFRTPFLSAGDGTVPAQGSRVFAIGSPLGMRDFVTSGIVTSIKEDVYFTDTQILPGNSGGPLLDESGQLLGVNTAVLHAGSVGSELFGAAISRRLIAQEFGHLVTKATETD